MASPQKPYTSKSGKARNSGPAKMRMSHTRLRKDIKRIESEQAKATSRTSTPRSLKAIAD